MKREVSLSEDQERQIIYEFMNGERDVNDIKEYPITFIDILIKYPSFQKWFEKQIHPNPKTPLLTSKAWLITDLFKINTDSLTEVGRFAPKGFVSMVLASRENYERIMNLKPSIFFQICLSNFPDVVAEYYISTKVQEWVNNWLMSREWSSLYKTDDNTDIERDLYSIHDNFFGVLRGSPPGYTAKSTNIPSLSLYTSIDQSFIHPDLLKACANDPISRKNTHDLFRITYPLGLPQTEYLYTRDVLLLVRVWTIDRILTLFEKEEKKWFYRNLQLLDTYHHSPIRILKYFQAVNLYRPKDKGLNLFSIWQKIRYILERDKVEFRLHIDIDESENIIKSPDVYIKRIEKDVNDKTTKNSLPLTLDFEEKFRQRRESFLKRNPLGGFKVRDLELTFNNGFMGFEHITINGNFKKMLTLESLKEYFEHYKITGLSNSLLLINHHDKELSSRLKLIQGYYDQWLKDIEYDLKTYPEDELFKDSNLIGTLNIGKLFERDDESIITMSKGGSEEEEEEEGGGVKSMDIFSENKGWSPYEEGNKWLNFLSKRLQFQDRSPENEFYHFGAGAYSSLFDNNISFLSCAQCKEKLHINSKSIDPWFGNAFCNSKGGEEDKCRLKWYHERNLI